MTFKSWWFFGPHPALNHGLVLDGLRTPKRTCSAVVCYIILCHFASNSKKQEYTSSALHQPDIVSGICSDHLFGFLPGLTSWPHGILSAKSIISSDIDILSAIFLTFFLAFSLVSAVLAIHLAFGHCPFRRSRRRTGDRVKTGSFSVPQFSCGIMYIMFVQ